MVYDDNVVHLSNIILHTVLTSIVDNIDNKNKELKKNRNNNISQISTNQESTGGQTSTAQTSNQTYNQTSSQASSDDGLNSKIVNKSEIILNKMEKEWCPIFNSNNQVEVTLLKKDCQKFVSDIAENVFALSCKKKQQHSPIYTHRSTRDIERICFYLCLCACLCDDC